MELFGNLSSKEYEDQTFSDLSLPRIDASDYSFESCTFLKCNFSTGTFVRTRFINCKFLNCDLSNANIKNARIRDSVFENCKLIGMQWIHLDDFVNPTFEECNLRYSNFAGLKLKKTRFFKCNLREVDFSQADLSESSFKESDLVMTRFNETNLTKADFREAINYIIDPSNNKIRGACFNFPEAQGLLAGLGIIIE